MGDKGNDCEQLLWVMVIWLMCFIHNTTECPIVRFWCWNLKERDHFGRPRCRWEDMLKWIFKKVVVAWEMLTRFI
jgi:hypothetical protein